MRGEAFAGDEPQEGGFAGAVGADQERAGAGRELEGEVLEAGGGGGRGEGVVEVGDGDGGAGRGGGGVAGGCGGGEGHGGYSGGTAGDGGLTVYLERGMVVPIYVTLYLEGWNGSDERWRSSCRSTLRGDRTCAGRKPDERPRPEPGFNKRVTTVSRPVLLVTAETPPH